MSRVRVVIHGRVQGVWFRGWTCEQARRLGLSGWVRNRVDGRVEVLAQGSEDAVERLLRHLHQGPRAARVTEVRVTEAEGAADPAPGFRAQPTA